MTRVGSRKRAPHPSRAASRLIAISEETLHRQVASYLSITIKPPLFWTTFPAGGGGKVRGAKLKALGLKAGMPDILVFAPGQTYGIELKTPRNYLDPVQRIVHAELKEAGVICFTAKSVENVALFLRVHRLLPHLQGQA